MSEYKIPATTPMVTRSPFVAGQMYLMRGEMFEDGRDRVVVPADTDDATVAEMTAQLEGHAEEMEKIDRAIAAVTALMRPAPTP